MISYHMHSIAPSYEGSTEVKLYGSTFVLSYFVRKYEGNTYQLTYHIKNEVLSESTNVRKYFRTKVVHVHVRLHLYCHPIQVGILEKCLRFSLLEPVSLHF
jgi:hypothetical protein